MTREELQHRLEALNAEFEKGQTKLRELQQQQSQLHETLLRIDGARYVLMELLEKENQDSENIETALEPTAAIS